MNGIQEIKQEVDADGNAVFRGGLDYMGDFDEGKCVKLKLKNGFNYIMCSSNHKKVNSLME